MKNHSVPRIIFVVGPTAVGKSAVALELAGRAGGEIVSCDALQVYREACIVSDQPDALAMSAVRHHLLGCVSVEEDFNVGRYRGLALEAIEDIISRGRLPVVCGGSGMYMAVLLDGIFEPRHPLDFEARERLLAEWDAQGGGALHARLQQSDPVAAARIHPRDKQRIIRALEVIASEGQSISSLQKARSGLWDQYPVKIFFLDRPRVELYARSDARVEQMLSRGLVEEVRGLLTRKLSASAARMIGVPEVRGYLAGEYDLARAKELIQRNTRHYIKRQLTWFRRDQRLERVEIPEGQASVETAGRILEKLGQ